MALPTRGRVIINTTVGEIDVELWSKVRTDLCILPYLQVDNGPQETPKTCRNFLALSMEGYYDGVIFHRVVPGFLVQTGDRTGTGGGGESFYGEPFEDEIHPRLRFPHRGLVAMANNGSKNSNDSQFFITLDRAEELHGKHTLFGRVMGDTIYSAFTLCPSSEKDVMYNDAEQLQDVAKIGDMEIGKNERPVYPPKIKSIRIVDNPFDDIVPRITAEEKRAQQRAREQAQREREDMERRKGAKKNVKLLSFGADEDGEEPEEPVTFKKKGIVRPDLIEDPSVAQSIPDFVAGPSKVAPSKRQAESEPAKAPKNDAPDSKKEKSSKKKDKGEVDITQLRGKHAEAQASSTTTRQAEIAKMESEIRKLTRQRDGDSSEDEHAKKKTKNKSYLEEELAKYSKGRGLQKKGKDGRRKDESDVLAALNSFRGKLQSSSMFGGADDGDEPTSTADRAPPGEGAQPAGEDPGMEVDDDTGFMSHALHFPKDDGEETRKAERDYEVIDPRQRGAQAKEEERERKKAMGKGRGGGRTHGRR
ncbi:hypothetical protein HGRIS_004582 [Hohenbuehelia grisea]|uniref:PPIase cyclophilin-type domain-containing protein n=1 Tax=Hohenbuehelia grisea TaxID=104357 RepID=A0ABR3JCJ8_9AGAR